MQFNKNLKIFLILYVLGFLIFNWTDVSWMFNYKAVGGLVHGFFYPYAEQDTVAPYYQNQVLPTPTIPEISSNNEVIVTGPVILEGVVTAISDKQNVLEIPAIGLETEVVFPQTKDVNILYSWLDKGVIYYPDSVLPNQAGQIILLGHSAPPGWPKIKHDTVFSNLEKLNTGDEVYLNLDYKKFMYIIKDKKIIDKGQEIPKLLTNNSNMIVLVSCYPPGKDYKRIAVFGEILLNK